MGDWKFPMFGRFATKPQVAGRAWRAGRPQCFLVTVGVVFLLTACASSDFQERAEQLKSHTNEFYGHLLEGRVTDAILTNERIEAFSRRAETEALSQSRTANDAERARLWTLVKAGHQTAGENWLTLGHFFTKKQRFSQARRTYQRVIKTYTSKESLTDVVERARTSLNDLELLDLPSSDPTP